MTAHDCWLFITIIHQFLFAHNSHYCPYWLFITIAHHFWFTLNSHYCPQFLLLSMLPYNYSCSFMFTTWKPYTEYWQSICIKGISQKEEDNAIKDCKTSWSDESKSVKSTLNLLKIIVFYSGVNKDKMKFVYTESL